MLIDTIGLGDPKMSEIEVVQKTKQFDKTAQEGVNTIMFVVRWARVS